MTLVAPVAAAAWGRSESPQGFPERDAAAWGSWHSSSVFPGVTPAMLGAGVGGMPRPGDGDLGPHSCLGWLGVMSGLAQDRYRCTGEGVAPVPGVSCGHPGSSRGCSAPVPAGCCGTGVMAPVPGVSCAPPGMLRVGTAGMRWRGEGGTGPGVLGACGSPVGHSWPPKPFRPGGPSLLRRLGEETGAHPAVQGQDLLPALETLGGPYGILGRLGGGYGGDTEQGL